MSGVYTRTGAEAHLLAAPRWNTIAADDAPRLVRRVLDLHAGVLHEQLGLRRRTDSTRSCSPRWRVPRPRCCELTSRGGSLSAAGPLRAAVRGDPRAKARTDGCSWMRVRGRPGSIVAAARDGLRGPTASRVLDRVAGYEGVSRRAAEPGTRLTASAVRASSDSTLCCREHRRAWASRWEDADIRIEGDPELQLAVRLALFHLLASARGRGRGGGRRTRTDRPRIPRPRVLGQRRVRAAVPRRDPSRRGASDARVPDPAAAGGDARRACARARRRPVPVGVGAHRART